MKGKLQIWILLLTFGSISLGAALNAKGIVGFWGMFAIMMAPNALLLLGRRRAASQS